MVANIVTRQGAARYEGRDEPGHNAIQQIPENAQRSENLPQELGGDIRPSKD
jgi:hypothetical protein